MHTALAWMQREKKRNIYISRMATYTDMVITKYEPKYEPRAGNAYIAELTFEQALFGDEPEEPQAPDSPQDGGQESPGSSGASSDDPDGSIVVRAIRAIGKWIFGG